MLALERYPHVVPLFELAQINPFDCVAAIYVPSKDITRPVQFVELVVEAGGTPDAAVHVLPEFVLT
jgi:hypothetical protein